MMENENNLLKQLDRLHTTAMGAERIRRNLNLGDEDVVAWCRSRIADPHCRSAVPDYQKRQKLVCGDARLHHHGQCVQRDDYHRA